MRVCAGSNYSRARASGGMGAHVKSLLLDTPEQSYIIFHFNIISKFLTYSYIIYAMVVTCICLIEGTPVLGTGAQHDQGVLLSELAQIGSGERSQSKMIKPPRSYGRLCEGFCVD